MKTIIRPEERGWDIREVNKKVIKLMQFGARVMRMTRNIGAFDYHLVFEPERDVYVVIFMSIGDWQSEYNLIITDMMVIPIEYRRKGYGTTAISILAHWCSENDFTEIVATQVSDPNSIKFWEKNGFVRLPEPNQTSDYIRQISPTI